MLTLVVLVLWMEPADNISDAACNVNKWTLLSERKTRRDRKREAYRFGEQDASSEISMDHESRENGLDLRDSTTSSLQHREFTEETRR